MSKSSIAIASEVVAGVSRAALGEATVVEKAQNDVLPSENLTHTTKNFE
jgi:hypothetical protein